MSNAKKDGSPRKRIAAIPGIEECQTQPPSGWKRSASALGEERFLASLAGISYELARIEEHFHWRPENGAWSAEGYRQIDAAIAAAETDAKRRSVY